MDMIIQTVKDFFIWIGPYITKLGGINLAGLILALFLWNRWKRTRYTVFKVASIICTVISIALLIYIASMFIPGNTGNHILDVIRGCRDQITLFVKPYINR